MTYTVTAAVSLLCLLSLGAFITYRASSRRERVASLLHASEANGRPSPCSHGESLRRLLGRIPSRALYPPLFAVLSLALFALTGNALLALLPWPCFALARRLYRGTANAISRRNREEQILELIDSLSQSLRSGLSLQRSLELSIEDVGGELREDVQGIIMDIRLGDSLEAALEGAASSADIPSLRLTFSVLGFLHGKGGDLPRVLDKLRKRVSEGLEARREARISTSQSRASGYLVSALPLVFFILQGALDPGSLRPLFSTPIGNLLLAVAAALNAAAFFLIRKIVSPEV